MQVRPRSNRTGFSVLEMLIATVILLVGLVAIAQLVPTSILLNYRNQVDSSAFVFGQRLFDQFLDQPIGAASFTDPIPGSPCAVGCSLGDPSFPNIVQGAPLVPGQVLIDFNQAPVAGYSLSWSRSNGTDPYDVTYDIRWAVIVTATPSTVYAKRFIFGVRQQGGSGYFLPVTLDRITSK